MKYILVIIDAFSRFAHTAPLKFKTAKDSAEAMDKIFSKFKFPPVMFTSDKGNVCIFDPAGMHRGGICNKGTRVALQILMK